MANYQELLSRAVGALPENNGASRREVYEKARKALVTQLRAINPPLPAREITQHRLELEDCIREVENQATEVLLGGLKGAEAESVEVVAPEAEAEIAVSAPEVKAVQTTTNKKPDAKPEVKEATQKGKKSDIEPALKEEEAEGNLVKKDQGPEVSSPVKSDIKASGEVNDLEKKGVSEQDAKNASLDEIIAKAEESKKPSGEGKKPASAETDAKKVMGEKEVVSSTGSLANEKGPLANEKGPLTNEKGPLTTESDKGVSAAMSRVREVDNESKQTEKPLHESASLVSSRLTSSLGATSLKTSPAITSPLEGAGIVGVGGVSSTPNGEKAKVGAAAGILSEGSLEDGTDDAQSAVDRAIETLDREARGEGVLDAEGQAGEELGGLRPQGTEFASDVDEERGGSGLTTFLVIVILLLGIVGGGGYWAWKEGYVDLDSLFAAGAGTGEEIGVPESVDETPVEPNPVRQVGTEETSGPGNTTTDVEGVDPTNPNVALEDPDKPEDRLPETDEPASDGTVEGSAAQPSGGEDKVEDRLGAEEGTTDPELSQGNDTNGSVVDGGAQSLLLEASTEGSSGAVPFSGTVEWSRGVDELGEPTIIGEANIPARNMSVKVLIRRNGDPSLPASHLMEIDFTVPESFAGGSVAGLPGILLKNEELVQGAALIGASARVVGNSFLFALSASEQDIRTNLDLLENRKWMDLALIYASGRRAIITLEKDEGAQALFVEVMTKWNESAGTQDGTVAVEGAAEQAVETVTDAVGDALTEVVEGAAEGATELIQDATTSDSNG